MITLPKPDHKAFIVLRRMRDEHLKNLESSAEGCFASFEDGQFTDIETGKIYDEFGKELGDSTFVEALSRIREIRAELDKLSEDQLYALYSEELEKQNTEDDQERFFSKPTANADFDYWAKMPLWSLDEALALAFGKSPKVVNKKSLSEVFSWTSPFVREYEKVAELARRSVIWQTLHDPTAPILFIKWAKETDIPLADELVEKVEARSVKLIDWKSRYDEFVEEATNGLKRANAIIDEKDRIIAELQCQAGGERSLGTRERESLLKMVIAMVVDGYGYDISAKRSPIPQQIADTLALQGIPLDVDTVRKWLNEAKDLLPRSPDDDPS